MSKKCWKPAAAAIFLTVAGFCYAAAGSPGKTVTLADTDTDRALASEILPEKSRAKPQEKENGDTFGADAERARTDDTPAEPALCYVHVCGEVAAPGVYALSEGSRVFEAVEAAGGMTEEASDRSLNLASVITDGMQIRVPGRDEAGARNPGSALESADGLNDGRIDLNRATKEELMTLPGIGAARAEDIIRYREKNGGFRKTEDIMKVSGIKNAGFEKIKDRIRV